MILGRKIILPHLHTHLHNLKACLDFPVKTEKFENVAQL